MDDYKTIPGFENYAIHKDGYVTSLKTGRRIKTLLNRGYEQIMLTKNKKQKSFRIHTLVASAYIPNPNNYPTVNHIDGIKIHNYPENLEWCSFSQNKEHAVKNGLIAKGAKHGRAKLSDSDVNNIKTNYTGMTCQLIADRLNVSKSTISRIRTGTTWK